MKKESFTRRELENWIAATRVEVHDNKPSAYGRDQRLIDAWAASAENVLGMLDEFMNA